LDGIMEKKGPQRLAECSFHENGHQLLCRLELISVHAIALVGLTRQCHKAMLARAYTSLMQSSLG